MPKITKSIYNGNDRYYLVAKDKTPDEIATCKKIAEQGRFSKCKAENATYTEHFGSLLDFSEYVEDPELRKELEICQGFAKSSYDNGENEEPYKNIFKYQLCGINGIKSRLEHYGFCLLADEQGLGKSLQAICASVRFTTKILVLSPLSVRGNWKAEFEKWAPDVDVSVVNRHSFDDAKTQVKIMNYDMLSRAEMAEELIAYLKTCDFDLLICDEAHCLKNKDAQRTEAVKKLAKHIKYKIALTGTPIQNRPSEIFGLLSTFGMTHIFKKYHRKMDFERRYCGLRHNGFGWVADGSKNEEELNKILRYTVMIRRLKEDVLKQLPEKLYKFTYLDNSERVEKLSKKISREDLDRFLAKPNFSQYASVPEALKELAIAKLPAAIAYIKNSLETLDKLVIFAYHREVIKQLKEALASYGAVQLSGSTLANERDANIKKFQEDPSCKVFIGQIQAAGVGITLTAANTVYFVEPDWVPANILQASDRCHRIGQKSAVTVEFLITKDGADEYIFKKVIDKNTTINKLLK